MVEVVAVAGVAVWAAVTAAVAAGVAVPACIVAVVDGATVRA
jgi:hypothetical protein